MTDIDALITEELERLVPVVARPDWETIARRAGLGRRRHVMRSRRQLSLVALAALVLAGASVAAIKEAPWWQSGAPPVDPQAAAAVARDNMPANVQVDRARTVATSGDAALVAVPLNATGYCLIPALDGRARFGAQCVYAVRHPSSGDEDSIHSVASQGSGSDAGAWIVYGRITDPRATSVEFGSLSVTLSDGGFFVANIPREEWDALSGHADRGRVLDSSGTTIRSGCISWGSSPSAHGPAREMGSDVVWSGSKTGACRPVAPVAVPTIDYGRAKPILDVTLAQSYSIWKKGQTISFYEAPSSDGNTCVVATGPGMTIRDIEARHVGGCETIPNASGSELINAQLSAQLAHDNGSPSYLWSVSGYFDPQKVATVKLRTSSGEIAAATGGRFFFLQLPEVTPGPSPTPALPSGQHLLIGYDSSGAEVAREDLNALYRASTPH